MSWFRVLWGSLPLGVCRCLWSGVSWPPWVRWVPSGPVPLPSCRPPSLVPRPCPLPPLVPVLLPVWWPLLWPAFAWRLGYGGGLRGCLSGSPDGCSSFTLSGFTLLPLCGVCWLPGASRCGSCRVRSALRRRSLADVPLRGSCDVHWGWGGAGLSVVGFPCCVCALVPVVAPSPLVLRPLASPFPGLLLVSRRFYSDFNTVFVPLLLLAAGVGFPAACF